MSPPSRAEDTALFDALYDAHHRSLYAFLLGQTGDREAAADLLQESFVRVWKGIGKARPIPAEQRGRWLLAIARNLLIDHYRRRGGRDESELVEATSGGKDPSEIVLEKDQAQRLDGAMGRLDPDLRTVLTMSVVGGLTSREIGETLGRPPGTVRYQLSEARKRLAEEVER
ncbi:RNA polymerase sigma factor [bacterium]|nr:MAG: RNA polymerase sigma factor [bacterium]